VSAAVFAEWVGLLNDAKQPKDENKDQEAAKTDIHSFLLFRVADETENMALPFPSLRWRHQTTVLFYPSGNARICLTFRPLPAISASDGGSVASRFSR
jgi:hypothetical protein